MTKKKIIAPNIIRGGAAIPLGDNIYLLKGKKHSQGGIDIGKDLEAEGDEVVKMNPKSIKVVTAQKIMGGKSPAELVVNASSTGEQEEVFNDVFKYQEKFKDRNGLNDDGTKKVESNKKYKAQIGTNKKLKDLAYKIITQDSVHDDAKAGIVDIMKGLSVKTPPKDDNKEMFIYGNVAGLPLTDTTKGKNFDEYIKINYPKRTIKQYEGIINPFNEYIIDEKNKGLIEALAEKNKHIYSILEDEYIHHAIGKNPDVPRSGGVEFMNTPYKDDVHSYPLQFSKNKNGDIIAHAADLYDFNYREYLKRLQFVRAAQAAALTAVGNPYILRQNDIPVRFINLKGKSNYNPIITYDGYERDMNLTDEERRAVNFNKILDYIGDEQLAEYLDNGYIEPSIITAKQKKLGGMKQFKNRRKFFTGGETETVIPTNKRTEGKDFLNKWYSNPTTKKIIEEVVGSSNTNVHEQINEAINSTPEYIAVDVNNKIKLPKEIIKDASIYNTKRQGIEYNPNESDNSIVSKFNAGDTQAFFNKGKGYILYKRGGNQPGVQASMLDRAVQEQVPEVLNTTKPVEDKLRKGVKYNNRLDNKNAVRSRIMELRYKTNLSPEKRDYTPEDVEELLKHENIKNTELEDNLKRLDTQTLSDYLNYMADSNVKTNTDNLAKLGTNKQFKGRHKAMYGEIIKAGASAIGPVTQGINAGIMLPINLGSVIGANVYTKKQLDKTKQSTLDYNQSVYDAQNLYNTEKYNKYNELIDKYYNEDLANLEKHKITRKDAIYNPIKLKTRININPQLEAIQRQKDENIESIVQNTSSSKDMLNRIRKERLNARDKEVALQGQKENVETQLINQDLLQRKATMEKQVDANLRIDELRAKDQENYYNNLAALNRGYNQNKLSSEIDYLQNKYNTENLKRNSDYEAENAYRQGRMENRMNLIQGISDSAGEFFNQINQSANNFSSLMAGQQAYGNNNVNSAVNTKAINTIAANNPNLFNSNGTIIDQNPQTFYNQSWSNNLTSPDSLWLGMKRFGGKTKIKRRNK